VAKLPLSFAQLGKALKVVDEVEFELSEERSDAKVSPRPRCGRSFRNDSRDRNLRVDGGDRDAFSFWEARDTAARDKMVGSPRDDSEFCLVPPGKESAEKSSCCSEKLLLLQQLEEDSCLAAILDLKDGHRAVTLNVDTCGMAGAALESNSAAASYPPTDEMKDCLKVPL
jgi:hypothetical protein